MTTFFSKFGKTAPIILFQRFHKLGSLVAAPKQLAGPKVVHVFSMHLHAYGYFDVMGDLYIAYG